MADHDPNVFRSVRRYRMGPGIKEGPGALGLIFSGQFINERFEDPDGSFCGRTGLLKPDDPAQRRWARHQFPPELMADRIKGTAVREQQPANTGELFSLTGGNSRGEDEVRTVLLSHHLASPGAVRTNVNDVRDDSLTRIIKRRRGFVRAGPENECLHEFVRRIHLTYVRAGGVPRPERIRANAIGALRQHTRVGESILV